MTFLWYQCDPARLEAGEAVEIFRHAVTTVEGELMWAAHAIARQLGSDDTGTDYGQRTGTAG